MKRLVYVLVSVYIGLGGNIYAQTNNTKTVSSTEKSETVSSLVIAQGETILAVINELYTGDEKIDVVKSYTEKITPKIASCLHIDMMQTAMKVQENASQGKFKRIKLRFEKPSDNTFQISGKTKRAYKRAYKKFKKEFAEMRKNKTLEEMLREKNLSKKVEKVTKSMKRQFKKDVRKATR